METLAFIASPAWRQQDFDAVGARSASTSTLIVPPTRLTTVGDRAFPVVAARVWNGLSPDVTRRPRHCLHSRDASRLNCLHGAIPIAPAASGFPFRLLVDAVTHVLSVFRVCKVP